MRALLLLSLWLLPTIALAAPKALAVPTPEVCGAYVDLLVPERPDHPVPLKLWAFDNGVTWMMASWQLRGASKTLLRVPVPSFLVESGDRRVLVDAGYNREMLGDPGSYLGAGLYSLILSILPVPTGMPAWATAGWVETLGVAPEDIDTLVITHPHFDHTGGISDFPNARVITGPGTAELFGKKSFGRTGVMDDPGERLVEMGDGQLGWVEGGDLLGDRSVVLVHLPGHVAGALGVWVQSDSGPRVLLVGDALYTRANLGISMESGLPELERPGEPHGKCSSCDADSALADETVQALWCLSQVSEEKELILVPSHDEDLFRTLLPRAPRFLDLDGSR